MPHVSPNGSYDLASSDEVKVYKDEGEEEDEKQSLDNLAEDKVGLVSESEEGKTSDVSNDGFSRSAKDASVNGKAADQNSSSDRPIWNPLISPYPFPNGATLPPSLMKELSIVRNMHHCVGTPLSVFMDRPFGSPPPAHIGIPPVHFNPKTGLPRPSVYSIPPPPGQFPHFYPELSSVQWGGAAGYPITSSSFRGGYPQLADSPLSRFSPTSFLSHTGLPPGFPHPGLMTKQDLPVSGVDNHRHSSQDQYGHSEPYMTSQKPKIKKPLNAFMLFMKEMRPKVIEECSLKESAAINQILGRRWHSLDRGEQSKYYEMARKEKELHMQLYPGWSARDNYGCHTKKKKRKRTSTEADNNNSSTTTESECTNPKKCRARFGLDQQNQWCQPCRTGGSEGGGECALTPLSRSDCSTSPPPGPPTSGQMYHQHHHQDIKPLLVDTSMGKMALPNGSLRSPGDSPSASYRHMSQAFSAAAMGHHRLLDNAISTNL